MTRPQRRPSPTLRLKGLLAISFSAVLGLALLLFTVASGASDMHHGAGAHPPVTLHNSGEHQASHDAEPGQHEVDTWCKTACAMSLVALAERGAGPARTRGVRPAIMGRTDEHSPDDPLPPPRLEAEV